MNDSLKSVMWKKDISTFTKVTFKSWWTVTDTIVTSSSIVTSKIFTRLFSYNGRVEIDCTSILVLNFVSQCSFDFTTSVGGGMYE